MQQILAFARKEFLLWAQTPASWVIVFIVPLIFIWIMSTVFGNSGTPVVTIYAVVEDESSEAERVMETLRSAENLKIEEIATRAEADALVGAGERMAAVIIPEGYGEALVTLSGAKLEVIIDPARSEQASIVIGLLNSAIAPLIVDAEVNRGIERGVGQVMMAYRSTQGQSVDPDTLQVFFTAALKGVVSSQVQEAMDNPLVTISAQPIQGQENARRPSLLDYLVPGYSLMFVFFLISNLAMTVIQERESGTLRRLLVTPVPRSRILMGKMLPYYLIAVTQFVFVLLVSRLAFGIDLGNSNLGLAVMILTVSLAMVSMGILLAAFAQNEGHAGGLSIVVVLAMAVVSGAMFPNISISGLQMITPHYWAMQGFINIISRGQGVESTFMPAGILLTMSAVFFTIGAIRFRFE